ncbi:MAG: ATP-binding protein [Clostridia bacterium]|nr:ATP-binding protein [Clostridia bacterium]
MSVSSKDIIRRVKEEYINRRARIYEECETKKLALYGEIPELREYDVELATTSTKIMAAITAGGNIKEKIETLRHENELLRKKRGDLLVANGYPADYTDIKHICEECNDSGYIGINMCRCMKQKVAAEMLEASGLGRLARNQSFENFSFDYYKGEDLDRVRGAYDKLKGMAEDFREKQGESWLLVGGTGLGKTHLSTATAVKVIEAGYNVVYETMQSMMDDFAENQFRGGPSENIEKYYDADLLIIDDMGSELTNQFTVSVLYNLINQRINKNKSTIISTNLTHKEIRERYDDRITSRLFGLYKPLLFSGTDVRRQKLAGGK